MKRFRFTFLAICMLLTWLGISDLVLQLRNPEPLAIELFELEPGQQQQEWLRISGGHLDLLKGINMSGTIEIDSFLIPYVEDSSIENPLIWIETRQPAIINLLTTYYFKLDNDQKRATYLEEHQDDFFPAMTITGMTADNLIANANRNKLLELLTSMGIETGENILFISEGKEPNRFRGPGFLLLSIIGVIKFLFWSKKPTRKE
jgi:hypothetical protein